ncbi:MAG: type VI secretion system tip protein TssI/VgrG [Desulfobacteraceae bacterium]|jgi:type VI secretion system secreted protein VgrG
MPREFLFEVIDSTKNIPLVVVNFTASEYMSKPFSINITLASPPNDPNVSEIEFDDVIAQPALLTIKDSSGNIERYFHGKIRKFVKLRKKNTQFIYRAIMVPEMWKLSLIKNNRIFHDSPVLKSNPGTTDTPVAQVILDEMMIDKELIIQNSYDTRDYCSQYQETSLNFISRLLEEEGIFYFFKHLEDENAPGTFKHTMVIGDSDLSYQDFSDGAKELDFHFSDQYSAMASDADYVYIFRLSRQIHSGKVLLKDFDFKEPGTKVEGTSVDLTDHGGNTFAEWKTYDYPGGYTTGKRTVNVYDSNGDQVFEDAAKTVPKTEVKDDGNVIIRTGLPDTRLQEESVKREMGNGESVCPAFLPGYKFTLKQHFRYKLNDKTPDKEEYVLTQVIHKGKQPQALGSQDPSTYYNTFQVIPSSVKFRPKRKTTKTVVKGPQTAIVVDLNGETENPGVQTEGNVHTDEYGRVRVRFHWERAYTNTQNKDIYQNTAWVRVSQAWAGQGWGSMHIPHVGQEVIVEFLDGDPDRPIITGRVYNGDNMPHNASAEDTMNPSVDSHISGFRDEFGNKLIFDSTAGEERVVLKSPKHDSYLSLGKEGAELKTTADRKDRVIGNIVEAGCGTKFEVMAGLGFEAKFAQTYEIALGQAAEFFAGNKIEFGLGTEYSLGTTKDLKAVEGDIEHECKKDYKLTAGDGFNIIGGTQDVSSINRSMLSAYSDGLMLSLGDDKETKTARADLGKLTWGVTGVASLFGIIFAICAKAFDAVGEGTDVDEYTFGNHGFGTLTAATAVIQSIISMVIGFSESDSVEPSFHEDPHAVFGMNEAGITLGIKPDLKKTKDELNKIRDDIKRIKKQNKLIALQKLKRAKNRSEAAKELEELNDKQGEIWKEFIVKSLGADTESQSKIMMKDDGSISINSNGSDYPRKRVTADAVIWDWKRPFRLPKEAETEEDTVIGKKEIFLGVGEPKKELTKILMDEEKIKTTAGTSSISVEKDSNIRIFSEKNIDVSTSKEVYIGGEKGIFLDSKKYVMAKGGLKHKNFEVLA